LHYDKSVCRRSMMKTAALSQQQHALNNSTNKSLVQQNTTSPHWNNSRTLAAKSAGRTTRRNVAITQFSNLYRPVYFPKQSEHKSKTECNCTQRNVKLSRTRHKGTGGSRGIASLSINIGARWRKRSRSPSLTPEKPYTKFCQNNDVTVTYLLFFPA